MPSSSPADNLFLLFTRKFDQLGSPYMVSGSVAAMLYGEPRLTNDVDLVVYLDQRAALKLPELFPAAEFYCPPAEIIAVEIAREFRGHFNILHIDSGFKADVYLRGNDPLHIWALEKSRRIQIVDVSVSLAPPEYVIIRKLEYFREGRSEKHLRDINGMLQTSSDAINLPKLNDLIEERALQSEWQQAKDIQL